MKIVSSTAKISVPDDLTEILEPIGQEEHTSTSPKHVSPEVFEHSCFVTS